MPKLVSDLLTINGIKTVGFPIVVAGALAWGFVRYIGPMLDENTAIIRNASEAIVKLVALQEKQQTTSEKTERSMYRIGKTLDSIDKKLGIPMDGPPVAVQPRNPEGAN